MRVFLDSNVVVAAHQWPGGVCSQVVERIYEAEYDLLISELVIEEVERILREKFSVPTDKIQILETVLQEHHVEPTPNKPVTLPIDDPDDEWVLAAAIQAGANILVTGDKPFRDCDEKVSGIKLRTPREFLDMLDE